MSTMTFNNVRLVKVVDGDTVRLDVDLGFNTWRLNEPYRLAHINAPELGTDAGWAVKLKLVAILASPSIQIKTLGKDKYGRWLIELFITGAGISVNQWLLDMGLAVPMELQKQMEQ